MQEVGRKNPQVFFETGKELDLGVMPDLQKIDYLVGNSPPRTQKGAPRNSGWKFSWIQTRDVAGVAKVRETIRNHIIAQIS